MTKSIWEKFDEVIDTEGLQKDAEEAANNNKTFEEIPENNYEVEVNKIELKESKKGDPMLTIWFKIIAGKYKGSLIFYNQVLNQGFGVHSANEMLRSLDSGVEIKWTKFAEFHELLLDIFEAIDGNLEYNLKYGKNAKGFNTYEIQEVYEKE